MRKNTLRDWLAEAPFTLALSSSFFGFYAHCGVVETLFGEGLIPRRITGSSAGALVGGALSSGLSPSDARELLFSVKKSDFWDPYPGPGLLRGKKFLRILEKHYVPSFDRTRIPFEAAVFDIFSCKTRFLKEGPLPKAVVASSKVTPCLRAFARAFCGSHSKMYAMKFVTACRTSIESSNAMLYALPEPHVPEGMLPRRSTASTRGSAAIRPLDIMAVKTKPIATLRISILL